MAWFDGADDPAATGGMTEEEYIRLLQEKQGIVRPGRKTREAFEAATGRPYEAMTEEQYLQRKKLYTQEEINRIGEAEDQEPSWLAKLGAKAMNPVGAVIGEDPAAVAYRERELDRGLQSVGAAYSGGLSNIAGLFGARDTETFLADTAREQNLNALYGKSSDSALESFGNNLGTGISSSVPGMAFGAIGGAVVGTGAKAAGATDSIAQMLGTWAGSATEAATEGRGTFRESEANLIAQGMNPDEARQQATIQGLKGAALNMALLRLTDKLGLDDDMMKGMLGKKDMAGAFGYLQRAGVPDAVLAPLMVGTKAFAEGFEERGQEAIGGVLGNNMPVTRENLATYFNTPEAKEAGYLGAAIGGMSSATSIGRAPQQPAPTGGDVNTPDPSTVMPGQNFNHAGPGQYQQPNWDHVQGTQEAEDFAQSQLGMTPPAGTLADGTPQLPSLGWDGGVNFHRVEDSTLNNLASEETDFAEDPAIESWNSQALQDDAANQIAESQRERTTPGGLFLEKVTNFFGADVAEQIDTLVHHFVAGQNPEETSPVALQKAYDELLREISVQPKMQAELLRMVGQTPPAEAAAPAAVEAPVMPPEQAATPMPPMPPPKAPKAPRQPPTVPAPPPAPVAAAPAPKPPAPRPVLSLEEKARRKGGGTTAMPKTGSKVEAQLQAIPEPTEDVETGEEVIMMPRQEGKEFAHPSGSNIQQAHLRNKGWEWDNKRGVWAKTKQAPATKSKAPKKGEEAKTGKNLRESLEDLENKAKDAKRSIAEGEFTEGEKISLAGPYEQQTNQAARVLTAQEISHFKKNGTPGEKALADRESYARTHWVRRAFALAGATGVYEKMLRKEALTDKEKRVGANILAQAPWAKPAAKAEPPTPAKKKKRILKQSGPRAHAVLRDKVKHEYHHESTAAGDALMSVFDKIHHAAQYEVHINVPGFDSSVMNKGYGENRKAPDSVHKLRSTGETVSVWNDSKGRGLLYQILSPDGAGYTNLLVDHDSGNIYVGMTRNFAGKAGKSDGTGLSRSRLSTGVAAAVRDTPLLADGEVWGMVVGGVPAVASRMKFRGSVSVLSEESHHQRVLVRGGTPIVYVSTPIESIINKDLVAVDEWALYKMFGGTMPKGQEADDTNSIDLPAFTDTVVDYFFHGEDGRADEILQNLHDYYIARGYDEADAKREVRNIRDIAETRAIERSAFLFQKGADGETSRSSRTEAEGTRTDEHSAADRDGSRGSGTLDAQRTGEVVRGAIAFDEDSKKAVIYLTEHADPSTILHELWHFFETKLSPANRELLDKAIAQEEKRTGETMDQTQRAEYFAEAAEEFFRRGKAPVPTLTKVFEKYKQWLSEVYAYLKGKPIRGLNPSVVRVLANTLTPGKNFAGEVHAGAKPSVGPSDRVLFQGGAHRTVGSLIDALRQKYTTTGGERSFGEALSLVDSVAAPSDKKGYARAAEWLMKWPRFVDAYSRRYPALAKLNRATRDWMAKTRQVVGEEANLARSWSALTNREQAAISVAMNAWSKFEIKNAAGDVIGTGVSFNTPAGLKALKDKMKWNDQMIEHYKERLRYYEEAKGKLSDVAENVLIKTVSSVVERSSMSDAAKSKAIKAAREAFKKLKAKLNENKGYVPFIRFGDHEAHIFRAGVAEPVGVIRYYNDADFRDQVALLAKSEKIPVGELSSKNPAAVSKVLYTEKAADGTSVTRSLGYVTGVTESDMKNAVHERVQKELAWDGKSALKGRVTVEPVAKANRESATYLGKAASNFSGYDADFLDSIAAVVDTVFPDEASRNDFIATAFPGMVQDEVASYLANHAQSAAHHAFAGRLKHRTGVNGMSNQGAMVDSHYARSLAREVAMREHYGDISEALTQVNSEAAGTNIPKVAREYWNYLVTPPSVTETAVTWAKGFTVVMRLGLKFLYSIPQQHLQRYSQEWPLFKLLYMESVKDGTISKKTLADIHDTAGKLAYRQLWGDFASNLKGHHATMLDGHGKLSKAGVEMVTKVVNTHKLGTPAKVIAALEQAIALAESQGTFDNQLVEDVVDALVDNRFVTGKAEAAYRKVVGYSSALSSPMESANRRRTFITDFLLSYTSGHSDGKVDPSTIGNWELSTKRSEEQVDRVHNQQGRSSRAGVERMPTATLLGPALQFKSFQIDYAAAFLTAASKAREELMKGGMSKKQATIEAFTPVVQGWAVTAALAGLKGSAYLGVTMSVLGYGLSKMLGDEWDDWEETARRFLMHHLGERMGRAVFDGSFNIIGLDIGSSFNMSDFFFIKPNASIPEAALSVVGGAFGGTVTDMAEGITGQAGKDYKNTMPDFAKAIARSVEGKFRANGEKIPYTPIQRGLKAFGVSTTAETREYKIAELRGNLKDARDSILKDFGEHLAELADEAKTASPKERESIKKDMAEQRKLFAEKAKDFNEYLKVVGGESEFRLDNSKLNRKIDSMGGSGSASGKNKANLNSMRKKFGT